VWVWVYQPPEPVKREPASAPPRAEESNAEGQRWVRGKPPGYYEELDREAAEEKTRKDKKKRGFFGGIFGRAFGRGDEDFVD